LYLFHDILENLEVSQASEFNFYVFLPEDYKASVKNDNKILPNKIS
jgi:hypothetical protein